jgi:hypothetical protein
MADPPENTPSRRQTVRDVLIFQVKLWLEGFKDIVLMPLSLGAAAVDLFLPRKSNNRVLYAVMKLGDRFERWVHLYAALEETEKASSEAAPAPRSLDDLLNEAADGVEKNVADENPGTAKSNRTS